jgi:hypothetical protein
LEKATKFSQRFERQLWYLFGTWILLSALFYAFSLRSPALWYLPDALGVIGGVWLGYRYFYWVSGFHDRAPLILGTIGSLVMAILVLGMVLVPYADATSPTNQYFGIQFYASDSGLASSLAAFGAPLVVFLGLSILYACYEARRTVPVH